MSIDNNNIDQLFRDAAHSQKAPKYDSAYWAEMNSILNAKKAKRRGFLFWAFGGSIAFSILLISLFVVNMDLNQPEKRYSQTDLKDQMNIQNSEQVEKEITKHNYSNKIEETNKSEKTLSKNMVSSFQSEIPDNILKKNQNAIRVRNTSVENSFDKQDLTYEPENSLLAKKKNTSENHVDKKSQNTEEYILNETISDNDYVQSLPINAKDRFHQESNRELSKSLLKYKPKPSLIIYAKLSGGLMENYKTSRPYESGLVDFSLNFEMNFDGLLLRSGIGTQITSNADLIVSKRAKVYGLGVINHQNDLSYQNLFDLYIPLEIGYKINATSFGLGAQANYLINTAMDLNYYENHNFVKTEKYNGAREGLNSFSTQGYVWLEHQFTSRLSLGMKIGTNISGRIKNNDYFNQSATTNPIYGQFLLRFNIIQ